MALDCVLNVQTFKKCIYTSDILKLEEKHHYASNLGAVLGQIATGRRDAHLKEQLMSMDIPTLSTHSKIFWGCF